MEGRRVSTCNEDFGFKKLCNFVTDGVFMVLLIKALRSFELMARGS